MPATCFVISYGKAIPFPGHTPQRHFFVVSRRIAPKKGEYKATYIDDEKSFAG